MNENEMNEDGRNGRRKKWYEQEEDWSEEDNAFVDEMLGKVWGDDYDSEED